MNDETRNELQWWAWRYVADEMTAAERATFERRLAEDDAACDAVEQAVEMSEAVRAVAGQSPVRPAAAAAAWSSRSAAWFAAIAAGVLLAVTLRQFTGREPAHDPQAATQVATEQHVDAAAPGRVSLAWAELRGRRPAEVEVAPPVMEVENMPPSLEVLESTVAEVPQWLLTAVSRENP